MNRVISFSINKTMEEVDNACRVAFNDYDDIDEIEDIRARKVHFEEWRSEVIFAYLEERVGDFVNFEAFATRCERNRVYAKSSREVNLLSKDEWERGKSGINDPSYQPRSRRNENTEVDSLIEKLAHEEERDAKRVEFEEFYEVLAIEHGVNIKTLIRKALSTGLRRYVNRIRYWIEQYEKQELIEFVLRDKVLVDEFELNDEDATFTRPNGIVEHNEVEPKTFGPKKFIVDVDERFKCVV
ncbi:hypothetical protein [Cohnella massiliensis]|uniref:hypothetical protein n=1 Tax=Cohnella massiliensis TaxID=1816691 RepID=UPI0009BC04EA|nr:hypothetical protein [Cohnella massiliensis]